MATTKGELLVKKWIKALRSGKYKQGRGYLARYNKKKELRYCPLGVLCDLAVKDGVIQKPKTFDNIMYFSGSAYGVPEKVKKYVGLRTSYGNGIMLGEYCSISSLNDRDKKKFSTIAKIIESRPEGLFED